MTTTRRKKETPEDTLARWMADPNRISISYSTLESLGWEPGQVAYLEVYGMRYERFPLANGAFVVIEWDDGGSISVA